MSLFYFYLFLTLFCEILAQYLFKILHKDNNNALKNKKIMFIFVGILLYSMTGFFVYKLLNYGHLGLINIMWHVLHFLLLFLISYFLLNERITQTQLVGIIFGMISLAIFMFGGVKHY
jgi:drug/metabolite transporter (DMT)-like permease